MGKREKSAGTTAIVIFSVATLVVLAAAVWLGIGTRLSASDCLADIQKRQQAAQHQENAGARSPSHQDPDPATNRGDGGQGAQQWPWNALKAGCRWPGAGEEQVMAQASLDLSFYGFIISVLFGSAGVIGIFLTYSLAREEIRRRRG